MALKDLIDLIEKNKNTDLAAKLRQALERDSSLVEEIYQKTTLLHYLIAKGSECENLIHVVLDSIIKNNKFSLLATKREGEDPFALAKRVMPDSSVVARIALVQKEYDIAFACLKSQGNKNGQFYRFIKSEELLGLLLYRSHDFDEPFQLSVVDKILEGSIDFTRILNQQNLSSTLFALKGREGVLARLLPSALNAKESDGSFKNKFDFRVTDEKQNNILHLAFSQLNGGITQSVIERIISEQPDCIEDLIKQKNSEGNTPIHVLLCQSQNKSKIDIEPVWNFLIINDQVSQIIFLAEDKDGLTIADKVKALEAIDPWLKDEIKAASIPVNTQNTISKDSDDSDLEDYLGVDYQEEGNIIVEFKEDSPQSIEVNSGVDSDDDFVQVTLDEASIGSRRDSPKFGIN